MSATEQGEALTTAYFYVELSGLSVVAFRELSGIGSEHDVIVQHQTNAQGKATYVKVPGKLTWNNIVLKKGIDTDMSLWQWRNTIITQGVNGQKKDGQIYIVDVHGQPADHVEDHGRLAVQLRDRGIVPDTNEMLLEEIHLAHEGLERVK